MSPRLLLDTHALIRALGAAPLMAQALVERLTIVTHDPATGRYAGPVSWD